MRRKRAKKYAWIVVAALILWSVLLGVVRFINVEKSEMGNDTRIETNR